MADKTPIKVREDKSDYTQLIFKQQNATVVS